MHQIKTVLIVLAIVVISIISFNCTVAARDRNFHNYGGHVSTVQDIPSPAGTIEINSKFEGKGAIGKKNYHGNKHWRRKHKRKHTGNNYWGTRVGYRDEPVIVFVVKEDKEEDGEKEEKMREEERMREEETRKTLERIKNEDWFR